MYINDVSLSNIILMEAARSYNTAAKHPVQWLVVRCDDSFSCSPHGGALNSLSSSRLMTGSRARLHRDGRLIKNAHESQPDRWRQDTLRSPPEGTTKMALKLGLLLSVCNAFVF